LEEVRALVRQPPAAAAVEANLWDGKSLSACLQQRYGVDLSVRQCQRLFRLVDTRYRLRRPLVAKADPQRQAEHKKNSRRGRKIQP
jgi:transposase